MIDPGRLKTRLVIEEPVDAPDGQGGATRSYAIAATVWASLSPLRTAEGVSADAHGALVNHRIIVRSNFTLTLRHRFRDGERVFTIIGIRDTGDRRFLEVDAFERVD